MARSGIVSVSSLERLMPAALDAGDITGQETFELHMARYRFAARFAGPGRVLDCACGVGYGSLLLAECAAAPAEVVGVDIDAAAIAHAASAYAHPRLRFVESDGARLVDAEGFDLIVSLETIEHAPEPVRLVDRLAGLLRPGGAFVASVPVTPSVDVNPYHLHDFTPASFRALFAPHALVEIASLPQVQPYSPLRMLRGHEARLADMRPHLAGYYAAHPRAAAKRLWSTLVDGFCNKYLTIAWRRP